MNYDTTIRLATIHQDELRQTAAIHRAAHHRGASARPHRTRTRWGRPLREQGGRS